MFSFLRYVGDENKRNKEAKDYVPSDLSGVCGDEK